MTDFLKLGKGITGALTKARELAKASKGTQDVLPAAEREANLAKMLEGSAVKDRVYHGTNSDIRKFSDRKLGQNTDSNASSEGYAETARVGHWFNTNPMGQSPENYGAGYTVDMPVYLSIKNPKREMSLDWLAQGLESKKGRTYRRELEKQGYDGLVLPDEEFGGESYVAFRPEQIKSATSNRGTYDLTDPDITKAKGGVLHMADAGRVSKGIVGALTKAAEMAQAAKAAKAASESKIADVLASQTPPMTTPQGTGLPLMPRDNGMYTLRDQKDLPRMPMVDKARAANVQPKYNERMQDLLDSPKARKKVDNLINKGKDLNVQEWYGTEPLRQVAMDAGRTPEQFDSMMAQLASASQRNPVDKQNQMGSYLYYLSETGQLPENSLLLTNKLKEALKADPSLAQGRTLVELPKGYGSLAQGDIFNRAVQIGQGDIAGALPPNKKLGTFYENLLGNLKPVTVDVNALRGPIIEQGDPRWLTSKLVEKDETGKIINSYKPREMYNTGEMSMREAQQRPGFWEAAPSGSEYAGFEDLWQRGAKRHGVEPAEAQALGWYGSADVTALKTKPENYVDNLERLIKRTAEQTGKSPTEVLNDMVTGKGFLRKEGGAIAKPDWHKAVEKHMKDGGYTFVEPKRMGEGGSSDDPKQGAAFGIYPKPKGGKALREAGEDAGDFLNALGKLTKDQGSKEVESLNKPRATMDIANRGILAPTLGLPADLANMALTPLDYLGSKLTGRDIKVSSDKPFLGSEYIKDLMDKYNVTSGEDRPMMETALSFLSPTAVIKGGLKAASAAKKAPELIKKTINAGMSAGQAGERLAERTIPQVMERGGVGADILQGMSRGTVSPMDVYHGSPHKFDRFDASKIGTGEGNQAYGYGLYLAENPGVAETYQKMVNTGSISKQAKKFVRENIIAGADNDAILKAATSSKNQATRWDLEDVKRGIPASRNDYVNAMDEVQEFLTKNPISQTDGSLYKVDLPDEKIAKMLDFDKHLSEQSAEVKNILFPYQKEIGGSFGTGEQTLKEIAFERRMKGLDDSPAAVAQQLRDMGIPGIKYLDGTSRGAGTGTRNFVTFPGEEQSMTILERNGQPLKARGGLTSMR